MMNKNSADWCGLLY